MILTKPLLHAFVDGLRGSHSASLSVHIQRLNTPDETWVWRPKSGWVSIKQILISMTYPWGCAALKPTMDSSFRAHNPFFHIYSIATNTSIFLPYHVSVVVATCWKSHIEFCPVGCKSPLREVLARPCKKKSPRVVFESWCHRGPLPESNKIIYLITSHSVVLSTKKIVYSSCIL